ncbi:hypothetical protein J6590_058347 [Homalodisca vitripennis]|nr:hypothetical protein J6590_058347 [Homalodisca vitripennis]
MDRLMSYGFLDRRDVSMNAFWLTGFDANGYGVGGWGVKGGVTGVRLCECAWVALTKLARFHFGHHDRQLVKPKTGVLVWRQIRNQDGGQIARTVQWAEAGTSRFIVRPSSECGRGEGGWSHKVTGAKNLVTAPLASSALDCPPAANRFPVGSPDSMSSLLHGLRWWMKKIAAVAARRPGRSGNGDYRPACIILYIECTTWQLRGYRARVARHATLPAIRTYVPVYDSPTLVVQLINDGPDRPWRNTGGLLFKTLTLKAIGFFLGPGETNVTSPWVLSLKSTVWTDPKELFWSYWKLEVLGRVPFYQGLSFYYKFNKVLPDQDGSGPVFQV